MNRFPEPGFKYLIIAVGMLLTALALNFFFISSNQVPDRYVAAIEKRLAKEISKARSELDLIKDKRGRNATLAFSEMPGNPEFPCFIYYNKRLVYWSENRFVPKYRQIEGTYDVRAVEMPRKFFIAINEVDEVSGKPLQTLVIIPLQSKTNIVNDYLKNYYNTRIYSGEDFKLFLPYAEKGMAVTGPDGQVLFRIKFGSTYHYQNHWLVLSVKLLVFLFLFFLILFFAAFSKKFVSAHQYERGFIFLFTGLLAVRAVMILTNFPYSFIEIDLFDPANYASSDINPSLGDLMLNLLALGGLAQYGFKYYYRSEWYKKLRFSSKAVRNTVSVFLIFLTYFWLNLHYLLILSLSFDSQWTMDITGNMEFSYLKLISYGLFFLSGVIYFLLTHISFKLFFRLNDVHKPVALFNFLGGTAVFILLSLLAGWDFSFIVIVNVIFYTFLLLFQLPNYVNRIEFLTFVYFFVSGIPAAVTGAYANYKYSQESVIIKKERLASQLLVENDPVTEFLLTQAAEKIRNDVFIQSRIYSPYASKNIIKQKIKREYLGNYLEQYDAQIYIFNSKGRPFESGRSQTDYFQLMDQVKDYKTDVPGLYFINELNRSFAKRYLYFITIRRYGRVAGYILLDLKLKRFVPNTVYPLLLSDNRYSYHPDMLQGLSYGIFDGKRLVFNYGTFNYMKDLDPAMLDDARLFKNGIRKGGYHHYGFRSEGRKIVVISSRVYPVMNILANFSFLFLIFVGSILAVLILISLYSRVYNIHLNYATRIQLYLNFAFFTPLFIISLTTMSIIVRSYKKDLELRYLEKAQNLSSRLAGTLKDYQDQYIDREMLSNEVYRIAQFAELDINLFNTNGWLIATSQPLIYENELLSGYINPRAYKSIVEERSNSIILDDYVGSLRYKNTYVGIRSFDDGSLIGVLSLPFFASREDLEKHLIRVLSSVIIVYTFIFIIFLFISYYASGELTFPLRLITQKIRKTTLSGYNEPLSWKTEDEIGLMVNEYNKMLVNLEESKKALARSEKESAWREMARQVAHEIKNPLTPMKLTLQHMKKKLHDEGKDREGRTIRQIDSLLQQVNTLNDIASSFSSFAQMPLPENERFELTALIREIVALYDKEELANIRMELEPGEFYIRGDRKWIGRAISNILINAIQSSQNEGVPVIDIRAVKMDPGKLRLEIRDYGAGIPEDIKDKVFTPNFSTKFAGSGLGLAIAKRGIEHAGGRIWFDSEVGKGTVFFIEFNRD